MKALNCPDWYLVCNWDTCDCTSNPLTLIMNEARREPMNFWDEVISKITRAGNFQEMSALCPFICLVQIQVTASKLEIASQSR
jgi:hypothetical protein